MKKRIALLTALLLLGTLCVSALADEGDAAANSETFTSTTSTKEITIEASKSIEADDVSAVYRCTIEWTPGDGSYYQINPAYTWNYKTLDYDLNDDAYDASNWEERTRAKLDVTVTNYSNVGVTAEMSFAAEDGITAYICDTTSEDLPEVSEAPSADIASAAGSESPEEWLETWEAKNKIGEEYTGTGQKGTLAAEFHMTKGFDVLLESETGKIGTATVTLTFGKVDTTYSYWDDGTIPEGYEDYDPLEDFMGARDTEMAPE